MLRGALLPCALALPMLGGCGPGSSTGFTHATPLSPRVASSSSDGMPEGGGFVRQDGVARRAWRTGAGEVASLALDATRGARVEIAVASADPAPVRARVAIRVDGAPPTPLVEVAIEGDGWSPIAIDLDPYAGRPVVLELRAQTPSGSAAAVDWGEPVLLERRDAPRPPNVVLVTLDTTRADVASDPEIAPSLAGLAARGETFRDAWSAATSTTPSHASILTGLPVEQHGASTNHSLLPEEFDTLAERLARRGYQTAASVTVNHIGYEAGFGQGFGRFRPAAPGDSLDGAASIDTVLGWLDEWTGADERPFFLWVHLFDPHTPYGPPRSFIEGELAERGIRLPPRRVTPPTVPIFPGALPTPLAWLEGITNRAHVDALYRAGVAYADHLVGRVVDRVDAAGMTDRTLFVVTADHGEALGEQGVFYQHAGLWPASLRVPLIVAGPGTSGGGENDDRVSGVDLLPSIVAVAEGRMASAAIGEVRDDPEHRVWFAETGLVQLGFRDAEVHYAHAFGPGQFGVLVDERRDGPHIRAIQRYAAGTTWLFDWRVDPELEHDLAGDPGAGAAHYQALVADRMRGGGARSQQRKLSADEAAALRALGYVDDQAPDRN